MLGIAMKPPNAVIVNAVFVVYWRVSRRGYWLLIVSAAFWLGTMVAMKLLLPLDYVPAKWSIPHWSAPSTSRHALDLDLSQCARTT